MYEKKSQPLLSKNEFYRRLSKNFLWASFILSISLFAGVLGYHWLGHIGWIDSLLNASMILTGMGPIDGKELSNAAKIFASVYALYSGVAFLSTIAVFFAPVVHRFMHKFHLQDEDQ